MAKRRKQRKRSKNGLPAKGRMRDIADRLWSWSVREDWNWQCAECRNGKSESHHIIPRQFEATRYELINGIALCSHHHKFDKEMAPHQNAAGWLAWLKANHPGIHEWYIADPQPKFTGTKTVDYYCGVIQGLREYVDPKEFERIVGVKFSNYLELSNE